MREGSFTSDTTVCVFHDHLRHLVRDVSTATVAVGFDVEFDSSVPFVAPKLILVQLCVDDKVLLLDDVQWVENKTTLRRTLNDARVVFCGRGVLQDLLICGLSVPAARCLDSSLGYPRVGLYDQVNPALPKKKRVKKDKNVQTSFAYGTPVTKDQKAYAATDAWYSRLLWTYREKLGLRSPFACPDDALHRKLTSIMRDMHARQEKKNVRFKLGPTGSVLKESNKLLTGQTFRTDGGVRYVVSKKNYTNNHRVKDEMLHGKFITREDDSDRLFRVFLDHCTEKLHLGEPALSPTPVDVRRVVRGPPGTGKTHTLVVDALKRASVGDSVLILCPKNVNCKDVHARLLEQGANTELVVMRSYCEYWNEGEYVAVPHVNAIPSMKKGVVVVAVTDVYLALQAGSGSPDHIFWDEASLQAGVLLDLLRSNAWRSTHWVYGDDRQMKPFGKNLKSVFDASTLLAASGGVETETLTTTYRVGYSHVWRRIFTTTYDVRPTFRGKHQVRHDFHFTTNKDSETKKVVALAKKWGLGTAVLCTSRAQRDALKLQLPKHDVMTIYKSQGSEWSKVIVSYEICCPLDDASRIVALTRATKECAVFVPMAWKDNGLPRKRRTKKR